MKSRMDLTVYNSHAHCDDACTSIDYITDTLLAVTDELKVPVEHFLHQTWTYWSNTCILP